MIKADELKKLDAFIKDLGPYSYLGPWLAESRAEIERDLRSDMGPSVLLPAEAHRVANKIVHDAQEWKRGFEEETRKQAEATRTAAQAFVAGVRRQAAADLRRALDSIG